MLKLRSPIKLRILSYNYTPPWDNAIGCFINEEQPFKPLNLPEVSRLMEESSNLFLHLLVCEDRQLIILKNPVDKLYGLHNYLFNGEGWFPTGEVDYNIKSYFLEELIYFIESDRIAYQREWNMAYLNEYNPCMSDDILDALWETEFQPYTIWSNKHDYLYPYFSCDDDDNDEEGDPIFINPIDGKTSQIPAM